MSGRSMVKLISLLLIIYLLAVFSLLPPQKVNALVRLISAMTLQGSGDSLWVRGTVITQASQDHVMRVKCNLHSVW